MNFYRAATKLADAHDRAAFTTRRRERSYDVGARMPCRERCRWARLGAAQAACRIRRRRRAIRRLLGAAAARGLSGRQEYREIAEDTLACFAGIVEHFGLYAGSYGLAAERLLLDPVQVVVVGSGPEAERLEATAWPVRREQDGDSIEPSRLVAGGVPEALEETVLQVPRPHGSPVWALVCRDALFAAGYR